MSDGLMERAKDVIVEALKGDEHVANRADFNTRVHDALSRFLYEETRRRPMVLPVSVEV
jgi:ribonuclease J